MAKVLITEQYLQDVADAIRSLNGLTTEYTPAQMAAAITALVTGCDATAANILSGKQAMTENGRVTGTMTNNGAVSKSITPSTSAQSYTVPAGYHNGSGKVTVAAAPTSLIDGTATAANVLSGQTFFCDSYTAKTGTMTNNGAVSKSITPSTSAQSYTIPAGYHNGSGKVSVAAAPTSLIDGTAAVADVLSGKTFFCDSYTAKTGTMTNRGAWAGTGSFTASAPGTGKSVAVTVPAGYHNGSGKVTVSMGTAKKVDWGSGALAIRSATATGTRIGMMYIGDNGGVSYAGDQYPVYPVGTSGDYTLCWMLVAIGKSYVV